MNTKWLIVFILLCFSFASFAENNRPNLIVITTEDSQEVALKKMGRILIDNDFTMENIDKDFFLIVTKIRKNSSGILGMYKYFMRVKVLLDIDSETHETKIQLSGKMYPSGLVSVSEENFDDLSYDVILSDVSSSMEGDPWGMLVKIAKEYPNGKAYMTIK